MGEVKEIELEMQRFAQMLAVDIREAFWRRGATGAAGRVKAEGLLKEYGYHFAEIFVETVLAGKKKETVTGEEVVTLTWPSTWWDAFKQAHMPNWWVRRWPVCLITKEVHQKKVKVEECRVCPHIGTDDNQRCLRFMLWDDTPYMRYSGDDCDSIRRRYEPSAAYGRA